MARPEITQNFCASCRFKVRAAKAAEDVQPAVLVSHFTCPHGATSGKKRVEHPIKAVVASAINDDREEMFPRMWNAEFIDAPTIGK